MIREYNSGLTARIASYELAYGMKAAAPDRSETNELGSEAVKRRADEETSRHRPAADGPDPNHLSYFYGPDQKLG